MFVDNSMQRLAVPAELMVWIFRLRDPSLLQPVVVSFISIRDILAVEVSGSSERFGGNKKSFTSSAGFRIVFHHTS
jgi:hypothetical protein